MKVAKANIEDIDTTINFLNACESIWNTRNRYSLRCSKDEWENWNDDDDDKIRILKIRRELSQELFCSPEDVDNRILMYEFIKEKYRKADARWRRVVSAADILIDNVCDPLEDHLAFYPGLEIFHVAPEQ